MIGVCITAPATPFFSLKKKLDYFSKIAFLFQSGFTTLDPIAPFLVSHLSVELLVPTLVPTALITADLLMEEGQVILGVVFSEEAGVVLGHGLVQQPGSVASLGALRVGVGDNLNRR